MSKNAVWLESGGDRVLVDVGSVADGYWRGLGYCEPGAYISVETVVAEKPVKKVRAKKIAEDSEA